jgi:hypothetical protein
LDYFTFWASEIKLVPAAILFGERVQTLILKGGELACVLMVALPVLFSFWTPPCSSFQC